ncbi:hypothetical protein MTX38_05640 [Rhodococcus sp. ARC_M13]|uniref:hypothetical protein n=1 Tax=Rhodococcus TaxID=1827 RepID=UPI000BB2CF5E|nr:MULTISPECIES: hypothetical protein [Rhodococcus]MCJ0896529.1 hypothetical protein [Rhodococcus sp. ARC_M13]PBI97133.1 hypothetical protein BKP42_31120 [Rhodococcus erythropolis]UKO87207.1 hypothetical protein ITJ47_05195 [Rhodococcus erythropolis]
MFRLYSNSESSHVLCCAHFPEFSGSSPDEEFSTQRSFDRTVEKILREASFDPTTLTLVGEQQGYPVGDRLFDATVPRTGTVSYAFQEAGPPWIVLGLDVSVDEFWSGIDDDEDLHGLGPTSPLRSVPAAVLTETEWPRRSDLDSP